MFINGFGAVCTAVVMIIFAVTKFREGAWVVLIIIPMLVKIFFTIHHHYKDLAAHLTWIDLADYPPGIHVIVSSCRSAACTRERWKACAMQNFFRMM